MVTKQEKELIKKANEQARNLGGRPEGSRNRRNRYVDAMGNELIEKGLVYYKQRIRDGHEATITEMVNRVFPIPKPETYVELEGLKKLKTLEEIDHAMEKIILDTAASNLSIEAAKAMSELLEKKVAMFRITTLEEAVQEVLKGIGK